MRKVYIYNGNVLLKYGVLFYMITAAWIFLTTGGGFRAAVSFFNNMETEMELETDTVTSTKYRYNKEFQHTLNHYRQFSALYKEDVSTAVPGLEVTEVLGDTCNQMVPQGICIAEDYMLVTAYDNVKTYARKTRQGGYKVSNSVLYVLSNQNPQKRQLLTTIVLPDVNHVGGVAFDGKNVWIAKSTTRQCSMISYEVIKNAAEAGVTSYELSAYDQDVPCGAVASFLTYHEGRLWVGTYANKISGTGTLRSYEIQKEGTGEDAEYKLNMQEEIAIPEYANGVEFLQTGGKTYMAVATSRGRYLDSRIYFYDVIQDQNTGKNLYYLYNSCKFPPMAEELVCDGENTYFLFESSATCYSTLTYQKCKYPVDRICAISTMELFWQNQGAGYRQGAPELQRMQFQFALDEMYQERKYYQKCRA